MDDSQKDLTSRQRGASWRSCPGHNGTEGEHAMNGSTTDLTSRARFELAIMSRAEPSRAEPSRAEPSRAEPSRGHDGASDAGASRPAIARLTPCRPAGAAVPSSKTASAAARPAGFARLAGARRGLVRSARALAAAALLAALGALALPATAQAQAQALVNNFDEVHNTSVSFSDLQFAQGFTTGRSDASFPLTSIEVKLTGDPTGVTATATVRRADSSGNPGAVHATLVAPTPLVVGNNTFTAPAGTRLAAERSYFLVLQSNATSGVWLAATTLDGQDAAPGSGWEIADRYRSRNPGAVVPTWASHSSAIKIRVNGTVPPQTPPTLKTGTQVRVDGAGYICLSARASATWFRRPARIPSPPADRP